MRLRRWSELSPFAKGWVQGTIAGYVVGLLLTLWVVFGR